MSVRVVRVLLVFSTILAGKNSTSPMAHDKYEWHSLNLSSLSSSRTLVTFDLQTLIVITGGALICCFASLLKSNYKVSAHVHCIITVKL